jgi:hypothetical protein
VDQVPLQDLEFLEPLLDPPVLAVLLDLVLHPHRVHLVVPLVLVDLSDPLDLEHLLVPVHLAVLPDLVLLVHRQLQQVLLDLEFLVDLVDLVDRVHLGYLPDPALLVVLQLLVHPVDRSVRQVLLHQPVLAVQLVRQDLADLENLLLEILVDPSVPEDLAVL